MIDFVGNRLGFESAKQMEIFLVFILGQTVPFEKFVLFSFYIGPLYNSITNSVISQYQIYRNSTFFQDFKYMMIASNRKTIVADGYQHNIVFKRFPL
ncbi:hypothetical protein BLD50_28020 [Bacillus cereus]|nr:hypothetical protein BLD50_28020 [Bacillus cereus]